jgi:hypothetical protein
MWRQIGCVCATKNKNKRRSLRKRFTFFIQHYRYCEAEIKTWDYGKARIDRAFTHPVGTALPCAPAESMLFPESAS